MKTKRRTLIVLLVFVLAAGAALTLLTHANQKAEQAASEAEDGSIPLLDVTTATLESVSIQYGGDTLTLRPSDDGWTLTEDPAYHLDDSACSTIRTALAGMKAKRQLEAQPGEDYGFDAPQLVVNVSAAGERTTLTVGAENPVTGDVYVRREGGDAVYTVDAAKFRCMEQTKAELFGAFSPAGITVSDIEAVRYTLQSGETIKLQSVSQPTEADSTTYQTVWQLTDEPDDALDTDKTDALLAALASYVTGQDTAADLSACGFDAPLVTAEVTTADGTVTLTYAIGTDGYYMMVSAEQAASEAEDGSIPLLDVTTATLESVSIQYGGDTLTLRPSDDGWTLTEDPAYHLDDSACSTIRTALAGMKAKRQLEAQPGEDYGFDAPQLVVNVSAAGERTTLTVGAENPVTGDVYVRREGGDAVYTVDAAKFRCMEQTKAELFGAFSPAGITVSDIEAVRYTLQSGETIKLQSVSQPTEADSTTYQTVWQLTDEPDDALDTDKTDALLAALASYVTGQDTAADLSACGFDAPLVTAEVTTADGTVTLTYAIGTDGYYMMVSGDSSVYTVDGQTVQALCLTARQLKADT